MESYPDLIRKLNLESWDSGPHQVDSVTLVIYVGLEIGIEHQEEKGVNDRRLKEGGLEETRGNENSTDLDSVCSKGIGQVIW